MKKIVVGIVVVLFLLSACTPAVDDVPIELPDPTETRAATATPIPTPTEQPPVVFTICTMSLPESLFPYDGLRTESKQRILSLLYPPPFEETNDELTAAILQKAPDQADGDLRLDPVPIRRGQTVVDARGEMVTALEGVQVRPSGCRAAECTINWDGISPLEMDQMVIDFALRADLIWSDGTPVTAADSVFSYRLASAVDSPSYGWAEARTQGYSALDDHRVSWVGYPGFTSPDLGRFFWRPLPEHAFNAGAGWSEVAPTGEWTSSPLSYGPFILAEWEFDQIRLVKDPVHVFAVEGQFALIDQVIVRVVRGGPQAGWEALQAGTCDMLDASFRLEGERELLATIQADPGYEVRVRAGDVWTQLVFGIQPAEYDGLANTMFADRPDYFGDARTRQGISYCLDREAISQMTAQGLVSPWPSFLPSAESHLDEGLGLRYDPVMGAVILEEAGWFDQDGDPVTPRVAQNVANVFNGTPLSVELLVSPSNFHQDLADMIRTSLNACGVGVEVQTMPADALYAPGPEGPLFGRDFDLALIAWQPLPGPDCGLYASWAVPTGENAWIGTNIAGLADEDYDQACAAGALALPGDVESLITFAEEAFINRLPAVPLVAPPVIEVWVAER